ncbi:MAG: hypothetical protein A2W28_04780 [Gammaproteobacteria bacterium RBG_16_51_14]|nr:MAG: hypothetical protein A2W28_04780 [Gammaproteobacteria bacterium RBG_16_51_14]
MKTPDTELQEKNPVIDEYARSAAIYDKKWSFYIDATACETMARVNLRPGDRVLDVGCGTGTLLSQLASSCPEARLSGIDLVPEMLAVARRRLPASIELRHGPAEHIPFDDGQFNVVVSCSMFHYIRNPVAALREMQRVLQPGGQLVITDWCDDYITCRICDWYLRLFNRAHFRTYGRKDCLRLLEEAAFAEVQVDRFKINWFWGLMTACAKKNVA